MSIVKRKLLTTLINLHKSNFPNLGKLAEQHDIKTRRYIAALQAVVYKREKAPSQTELENLLAWALGYNIISD